MPHPLRRVIASGASVLTIALVAAGGACWLKVEQVSALNFRTSTLAAIKIDLMQARHDLATSGLLIYGPGTNSSEAAETAGRSRLKGVVTELRQRLGADEHLAPMVLQLSSVLAENPPDLGIKADHLLADMLVEVSKDTEQARAQSLRTARQAAFIGFAAGAAPVAFLLWLSAVFRRRERQQFAALLNGFEHLRRGDFDYRVPEGGSDTGPLALAFNTTSERLGIRAASSKNAASQDQLAHKILDSSPRVALLINKDGTIAKANIAAEEFFQRSRAELSQLRLTQLLPEELVAASGTQITSHKLTSRRPQRTFEECTRFVRPDGSEVFVDFDIVLIDADGEILTYAVITDITARAKQYHEEKAAHARTLAELERHKMVTEAAELGTFLWDLRDDSLHADNRYLQMLGETRESFAPTSQSFFSRTHPDDTRNLHALTQEQLEGKRKRVDHEFRIRHKNGHWMWISSVASTVTDSAGNIIAIAGLHRDISDEIATRNELESQRRLLSSLSGNIPSVLHRLVAHPDGRRNFRYVGENSEAVLGVPSVQFDLDALSERMQAEPAMEFLDAIEYCIKEGFDINREFRVRRGDGEWRWVRMVSHLVASTPGGGTWDGIFTDVTEQVAQRVDLEAARKEADKANRAKSNFLASMSHELRTPLSGMLAVTELLQETKLDPDQRELLGMQREAGQTLMAVLTDVLDLSKIESGKFDLEAEVIDIEKLVRRTMDVVHTQAATKGLALRSSIAADMTQYAIGDSVRLRQVLLNLLNNAVKFTNSGSVDIQVEELRSDDDDHHLFRFTVTDTGVGIDAEAAKSLFQPFRQLGESSARVGGTGLGLALCQKFIELMNGRIGYESAPGGGSQFWFTVPLRRVQGVGTPTTRWQPSPTPAATEPMPKSLRVLVAEDIKLNQMITARALERAGHEVELVANGEEALHALGCGDFDAIIMDARMPVLDGVEATRRIRATTGSSAQLPIIGLTADVLPARLQECLDAGMNEVLTKPFERLELMRLLESLTSRNPNSSGSRSSAGKPDAEDEPRRSVGS